MSSKGVYKVCMVWLILDIPMCVLGMFLDLCLSTECFNKARSYLQSNSVIALDFTSFLELYTKLSGLLINASIASKEAYRSGKVPYWVPKSDGMWMEVLYAESSHYVI